MKFCLLGDGHVKDTTPSGRVEEDFRAVCLQKLDNVLSTACERACRAVLQAGDFFDKPSPSKGLICDIIELIRKHNIPVYAIHGQHDMLYHSLKYKEESALRIIATALPDLFKLVDCADYGMSIGNVDIYGHAYGETPKMPKDDKRFNICISHAMVGDNELYPGQPLISPSGYVKKYAGYNLYLLGDYHYSYEYEADDVTLINCGAMLRLSRSDRDRKHKPHVVIFDTETLEYELEYLSVKDNPFFENDEKKKENKILDEFVAKLRKEGSIGTSFFDNLDVYVEKNKIDKKIVGIIKEGFVS